MFLKGESVDSLYTSFTIERELTPEAIEKTIQPQILKLKEQFDALAKFQTSRAKATQDAVDEMPGEEVPTIQVDEEERPPLGEEEEEGDY